MAEDWAKVMEKVQLALRNSVSDRLVTEGDRKDGDMRDGDAVHTLDSAGLSEGGKGMMVVETVQKVNLSVPISIGELVDKITILEIKVERLKGDRQKDNAQLELDRLREVLRLSGLEIDDGEVAALKSINGLLWNIEDRIRELEKEKDFGEDFIYQARSVYLQNDRRAALKRQLNTTYRSEFIEEKSYEAY